MVALAGWCAADTAVRLLGVVRTSTARVPRRAGPHRSAMARGGSDLAMLQLIRIRPDGDRKVMEESQDREALEHLLPIYQEYAPPGWQFMIEEVA